MSRGLHLGFGIGPATLLALPGRYLSQAPNANFATGGGAFGVQVVGGQLVRTDTGAVINLRGADTEGMEATYALGGTPVWGYGGWTDNNSVAGHIPPFAALKAAYGWNVFRIPLHVHSVLGFQTVYQLRLSDFTTSDGGVTYNLPTSLSGIPTVNMSPGNTYLTDVQTVITAATAANCIVILDLHLWAPDVTIGGTTVHLWNASQDPGKHMPDYNAIAACTAIGNLVKGNPAVMFDLVNEPTYPTWTEWMNGKSQTQFDYQNSGYIGKVNSAWTQVGMSAMLAAFRATGAGNVCLLGGVGYAGELGNSQWITGDATGATWLSTVQANLSDTQICASIHLYPNTSLTPSGNITAGSFVVGRSYQIQSVGTTSFTAIGASANSAGVNFTATGVGSGTGTASSNSALGDANYYHYYTGDNAPGTNGYAQWISIVQAIIAAGFPVVAGEIGGQSMGAGTEAFMTNTLNAIDTLNATKQGTMHAVGWGASPYLPTGANFQLLQYPGSATYTPTTDNGAIYTGWTSGHSAP